MDTPWTWHLVNKVDVNNHNSSFKFCKPLISDGKPNACWKEITKLVTVQQCHKCIKLPHHHAGYAPKSNDDFILPLSFNEINIDRGWCYDQKLVAQQTWNLPVCHIFTWHHQILFILCMDLSKHSQSIVDLCNYILFKLHLHAIYLLFLTYLVVLNWCQIFWPLFNPLFQQLSLLDAFICL